MKLFLAILFVLVLLLINEAWWQQRKVHGEFSRKFVHITVGSFVAFWPFFLSWHQIGALSVAFLIGVGISKYLRIFQAIHSVQRPTWGEVFFALAVGIIALVTQDKWTYAAALLQMGLADGLAAVVGTRYGQNNKYLVLGHAKSVIGTGTFFIISLGILLSFGHYGHLPLNLALAATISTVATLLENIAVHGLDNLLVPLLVALLLSHSP